MKAKRILKVVGNVFMWVIFALALITVIMTFNPGQGISNFFGTGYLSVQSSSMSGIFEEGDLIFVHTTTETDVFEIGDIVTFRTIIGGKAALNTHRIIGSRVSSGVTLYTTKGDNVDDPDLAEITAGDIVAKYTGYRMAGIGNVLDYLQTSTGYLICVVLPLAALFIYQIVNFSMLMTKYKQAQQVADGNIDSLTEEQKEEIAKKYLEKLNKKE